MCCGDVGIDVSALEDWFATKCHRVCISCVVVVELRNTVCAVLEINIMDSSRTAVDGSMWSWLMKYCMTTFDENFFLTSFWLG